MNDPIKGMTRPAPSTPCGGSSSPLMRPIVATVFILNALSVWNDFASPQVILGPGNDVYTVTTGV
ncbi:hypothetical protein ACWGH3_30375 [Streptomyces sp. NPDC054884]